MPEALPSEFLDQFQEHFDCWNRGDLDLMLELYAEDAVFDVSAVFPDVALVRGSENIRRYWETFRETWDGIRINPVGGLLLEDGRLIVDQRMWAKGTRSGIDVDQRVAMLYRYRPEDNMVVEAALFPDVDAALAAAGSASASR
jgi:ketosteroid isomerase-like protein